MASGKRKLGGTPLVRCRVTEDASLTRKAANRSQEPLMWKYLVLSGSMSRQRLTLLRASASYFEAGAELEGDLTAGPLLLPGNPGTLAAS